MLIKLRFRFPEVLFGILLAVAIFAMGAMFWSSPNSSAPTQSQASAQSSERSPGNKQEIAWWQDPVAVFTLGLVFIGLLQAGIFYGQMRLIRKSLSPAKEAAEAAKLNAEAVIDAERAYMFVEIGGHNIVTMIQQAVASGGDDDKSILGIHLSYNFKNYGRTPAIIREIEHSATIAVYSPKSRMMEPIIHLPCHIIAADKSTPQIHVIDLPRMTAKVAQSIRDCENTFWFEGKIVYDDMFGWRRTFNFIWHISAVSEGFTLFSWAETQERRDSQNAALSQPT
jgi:hypothetical protein